MMQTLIATSLFFALCMGAISIGVLISGRQLRGSCGGVASLSGKEGSQAGGCGVCAKKSADVCSSSKENGFLVKLATLGFPKKPVSHD